MNRVLVCLVTGGCAFVGGAVAVSFRPTLLAQLPTAAPAPSAGADLTTLSDRFETITRRLEQPVVRRHQLHHAARRHGQCKVR